MWGTEALHMISAQFGVIVLTTSAGIMDHEVCIPAPQFCFALRSLLLLAFCTLFV